MTELVMSAGLRAASLRADSRLRAGWGVKTREWLVQAAGPRLTFMLFSTSPRISTRSDSRQ